MKRPRDQAEALLRKAANDLITADAVMATGKALDMACFHAQQAVEKSLKAILALHDVTYPWRHDLAELLALAKPLAPEISAYEEDMLAMAGYAVSARYDADFDPAAVEAAAAYDQAVAVYRVAAARVGVAADDWLP